MYNLFQVSISNGSGLAIGFPDYPRLIFSFENKEVQYEYQKNYQICVCISDCRADYGIFRL